MKLANTQSEMEVIKSLATQYENRGYRILIHPSHSELPSFFKNYRPDMVALSEKENVAIEVKSGEPLAGDKRLLEIARLINKQEGWRLEVLSLGQRPAKVLESEPIPVNEVRRRMRSAQILLKSGQLEAALLLAWSALEGALRRNARASDINFKSSQLGYVIRQAYSSGILNWREYNTLVGVLEMRNRIAHGLRKVSGLRRPVEAILRIAERLNRRA